MWWNGREKWGVRERVVLEHYKKAQALQLVIDIIDRRYTVPMKNIYYGYLGNSA